MFCRATSGRTGGRHDLEKCFFGPDHAEIGSGAFFSGLGTLFEIVDFRFERLIAVQQDFVLRALLGDRRTQVTRLGETGFRKPKLRLQCQRNQSECGQ